MCNFHVIKILIECIVYVVFGAMIFIPTNIIITIKIGCNGHKYGY